MNSSKHHIPTAAEHEDSTSQTFPGPASEQYNMGGKVAKDAESSQMRLRVRSFYIHGKPIFIGILHFILENFRFIAFLAVLIIIDPMPHIAGIVQAFLASPLLSEEEEGSFTDHMLLSTALVDDEECFILVYCFIAFVGLSVLLYFCLTLVERDKTHELKLLKEKHKHQLDASKMQSSQESLPSPAAQH